MKKLPWKQIFTLVFLGVGVFIVVEIYKAFQAGVTDIKSLLLAPVTALQKVWSSITSLAAPSPTSSPAALTASVGIDPNSALGQMFQADAQIALAQVAAGDAGFALSTPADNSSTLPVVGIWSANSP